MSPVKAQLKALVDRLPDDCTFEDAQYELYVLEKIRKAEESIERDGSVPHEEAKARMSRWLSK